MRQVSPGAPRISSAPPVLDPPLTRTDQLPVTVGGQEHSGHSQGLDPGALPYLSSLPLFTLAQSGKSGHVMVCTEAAVHKSPPPQQLEDSLVPLMVPGRPQTIGGERMGSWP